MNISSNAASPMTRLEICPWSNPTTNKPITKITAKITIDFLETVDCVISDLLCNMFLSKIIYLNLLQYFDLKLII